MAGSPSLPRVRAGLVAVLLAATTLAEASAPVPATALDAVAATTYDLHLKLTPDAEAAADKINARIGELCPHNDINFNGTEQPHISLYLTSFQSGVEDQIKERMAAVAPLLAACNVTMTTAFVQGAYAMWTVVDDACLQTMSDVITAYTTDLAVPNQPVPGWVAGLPQPERAQKTAMVQRFGSPNVFVQFQPHVTLAYDNATSDDLAGALAKAGVAQVEFTAATIAIGQTGPHGTVLRGKDLAEYPIGGGQ